MSGSEGPGAQDRARRLVEEVTARWAASPGSGVVWTGDHEGRHGVRLHQVGRDFTTVWFRVGERTLAVEAYVLPAPPPGRREEAFRQCLARNLSSRRLHFALDRHGDLLLVGRVPLGEVDEGELELVLGEAHEAIALALPALGRASREREKNP
ncbi:MAG: YbjN domain-containing protein [Acidimicrobiia bacterium]|nr:YbjN domain-containing protein [Acidimicrobiia bacterium]